MHFKNSYNIRKEKYRTREHRNYGSTGNDDKKAFEDEPKTWIEAILSANPLGVGISINTIVEYASE